MFKVNKDKKKAVYVNKTFRLSIELTERLQLAAQQENVSLNKLVAQCCHYALDNLVPSEDNSKNDK